MSADTELEPEGFDTELITHRRRRRAILCGVVLLVVGTVAGGLLGWSSEEPLYRATGLLYIASIVPTPTDPAGEKVLPGFDAFVRAQVALMESERLARLASEEEPWRAGGGRSPADGVDRFKQRLRIQHAPRTQHIAVHFTDANADVALAGVRALIDAYTKFAPQLNGADVRLDDTRAQIEVLRGRLHEGTDHILALAAEYGGVEGLILRHQTLLQQLLEAEDALAQVRREKRLLTRLEALRMQARKSGRTRADVERLQAENEDLTRQLAEMSALKDQLTSQLTGPGRILVVDHGMQPTEPWRDRRASRMLLWGALGAIPGFLVLLFLGSLAPRSMRRRETA